MIITKNTEKPTVKLTIDGEKMVQVQAFTYFGEITEDGRCEKEN